MLVVDLARLEGHEVDRVAREDPVPLVDEDRVLDVRKGSIIYVKAGEDHRFTEITEDLELLVLFSTGPTDAKKDG